MQVYVVVTKDTRVSLGFACAGSFFIYVKSYAESTRKSQSSAAPVCSAGYWHVALWGNLCSGSVVDALLTCHHSCLPGCGLRPGHYSNYRWR